MRKFLFLLITIPSLVFSQNKINGIGKLQLGMTVTEFEQEFLNTIYFQEKANPKQYASLSMVPFVDNVKTFQLKTYEPVKGYTIDELYVYFYNDSLYMLKTKVYTNITEALTLKYGEPKTDTKETSAKYKFEFTGAVVTKTNYVFTNKWNTGHKDIECLSIMHSWHDSKGKEITLFEFNLFKNSINNIVNKKDEINRDVWAKNEKDKKSQELDNL